MSAQDSRGDINATLLLAMAEKVSRLMQTSHGVMAAWSTGEVANALTTSLEALKRYPEVERTHGLIHLTRSPGSSSDYLVSLNLGILMHFDEQPEETT